MTLDYSITGNADGWRHFETVDDRTDQRMQTTKEAKAMAITIDSRRRANSKFKRTESIEFRLIFIMAFAVFLVTATAERLLPTTWLRRDVLVRKSIFEQAKEAANTCAAYAFMG